VSANVKSNLNPNDDPEDLGQVSRPLPLVTIENSFFWEAGKFGELRFQKCRSCENLRFPIAPICPYCRSTEAEIVSVSGRAVVVGCTVNHQAWSPALEPPYSIAVVAIEEDPRVRLTTNIIGCRPDEVYLGQRVSVEFLQQSDSVWLPLFSPTGEADGEWLVPEPVRAPHQTVVKDGRFESRSAITGIGMSEVGRRLMRPPLSLALEASLMAIEDAGLTVEDIDGVSTYPGGPGSGGHGEGGTTPVIDALRLQPTWINGGGEMPGQIGALVAAMLAVAGGLCRHVLVYRTVWEATFTALQRQARSPGPGGSGGGGASGFMEGRLPFGAFSAAT